MAGPDLLLDKDVRDWVLIPITVSIILMKLVQQYAVKVGGRGSACIQLACSGWGWAPPALHTPSQSQAKPGCPPTGARDSRTSTPCQVMAAPKPAEAAKPAEVQQKSVLARSGLLRTGHAFISESGFRQRVTYFAGKVWHGLRGECAWCASACAGAGAWEE